MTDERHERGVRNIRKLNGPQADELAARMTELEPQLGRFIVDFIFGEIYERPGLSFRDRQIANVAALTALGTEGPLRVHIQGALNVGVSREEVLEVILQMAAYAGFPRALTALHVAGEAFAAVDGH